MGKRRDGREAAVQYLFFHDLNRGENAGTMEDFWALHDLNQKPASKAVREFALNLTRGVRTHREELDKRISDYTSNYNIDRISAVDRNVLRLALYEMFHRDDVPPVVAINEAIEVAKRFGMEESSRFVNGILDRAKRDLTRPIR